MKKHETRSLAPRNAVAIALLLTLSGCFRDPTPPWVHNYGADEVDSHGHRNENAAKRAGKGGRPNCQVRCAEPQ